MKNKIMYSFGFLFLFFSVSAILGAVPENFNKGIEDSLILVTNSQIQDVSGSGGSVLADPEIIFFPKKISQKDILVIIRKNNETADKLKYIVKAGTKSFNGEFKGSKSEMKTFINLADQLNEISGINKINVDIMDSNGNSLLNTDIPLVTSDED